MDSGFLYVSELNQVSLQKWYDFWYYYKGEPQQKEALEMLWKSMPVDLLREDAPWIDTFRSKPPAPEFLALGHINNTSLQLIKEFEGLRLESYICPAGVWTVGYGHTGNDVYPGMEITHQEADEYLRTDVIRFEEAVKDLIEVPLTENEYGALVSFTYNCGEGALQGSTLRRRLNRGDSKPRVFQEELVKWVHGGGGVLPGLVRRRNAEIALALS